MRVVVSTEYRFSRTGDGAVWTDAAFARAFWSRYLDVFDSVRVAARAEDVPRPAPGAQRVDGDGVELFALPYYVGPAGFLRRYPRLRRRVRAAAAPADAVILRVPSPVAAPLWPSLARQGRPFGLEVVGDPHETFAAGSVDHPARPVVRRWLTGQLRRQCQAAAGVAYVTERRLQRLYPAGSAAHTTSYSSIDLGEAAFVQSAPEPRRGGRLSLVTVASLEQLYKGTDVLVDAVAALAGEGRDVYLTVVGDGRFRPQLAAQAAARAVGDRIGFAGTVPPGDAVRTHLDAADLFVLSSRTEGLPRAMVEAMARGLPCIGSTAGGIPELLDPTELVPPGDATALAARIAEIGDDPERRHRLGARNLARARDFESSRLQARRRGLYTHVREVTQEWLARRALPRASST